MSDEFEKLAVLWICGLVLAFMSVLLVGEYLGYWR